MVAPRENEPGFCHGQRCRVPRGVGGSCPACAENAVTGLRSNREYERESWKKAADQDFVVEGPEALG